MSLAFGSRTLWKGTTGLTGITSLASLPADRDKLICPIKSGGLSIVARCVIEKPLWVEIVLMSWWDGMSKILMFPVDVPTSNSEDVRDIVKHVIGCLEIATSILGSFIFLYENVPNRYQPLLASFCVIVVNAYHIADTSSSDSFGNQPSRFVLSLAEEICLVNRPVC